MAETSASTPAAPVANNPWLKGPPQQLKAAADGTAPATGQPPLRKAAGSDAIGQTGLALPPPPPAVTILQRPQPKIARAHHHLSPEEQQINAFQLHIAQQFMLAAHQAGMDLATYQAQVAMSYGFDPRILAISPEPGTRLDGTEPQLGLSLVRDEQAYTHVELLTRYPHLATVNLTVIELDPRRAAHFLVTCAERQVHESLKYGSWPISAEGAKALNMVFGEMHGLGPVYFLMASTDSVAFSGVAEMVSPAMPINPENPEAMHRVIVRWVYCKNIPFSHMNHVALRPASKEAEEQRRIYGGMQPMRLMDGNRALHTFARYPTGNSVLMDFKYYDDAEARGVQVESGDAAIRAANKYHQKMAQGGGEGGGRGHYQGGGGRGGHFQQRSHHQHHAGHQGSQYQQPAPAFNNPAAFPTPAQAASGAAVSPAPAQSTTPPQNAQQPAPAVASNPQQPARGGGRPFQSDRGGRQMRSAAAPSRQIVTADEERVNLQTKYVFEPILKEKQSRRRRNRNPGMGGEDEGEYASDQQGEGQQDEEQAAEAENTAQDVNGEEAA